jgi:N-methylhydantoinase B
VRPARVASSGLGSLVGRSGLRQPAWGLFGGDDAVGPEVVINPDRQDERRLLKVNGTAVRTGDVIRCAIGGGGGYGDPVERAEDAVRADVRDRNLTEATAFHRYGISPE